MVKFGVTVFLLVMALIGLAIFAPDTVRVYRQAEVREAAILIFQPWAEKGIYIWRGPDGISYQVQLPLNGPRRDGCYHLFPPRGGEPAGKAIWFAPTCPHDDDR